MIMFESVRLVGNNLFIDNVSVNILTDIAEEEISISEEIKVYPNPSNGKIITELNKNIQQGRMMVYNSQGVVIFDNTISDGQQRLSYDLSGYPNGIYIIRITGLNFDAAEKVMIK